MKNNIIELNNSGCPWVQSKKSPLELPISYSSYLINKNYFAKQRKYRCICLWLIFSFILIYKIII